MILRRQGNSAHHDHAKPKNRLSVAVAQLGFRMHYGVPVILHRAELLESLYTDLYIGKWPWKQIAESPIRSVLPRKAKILLARQAPLPSRKVRAFQRFGLAFLWKLERARPLDMWKVNTCAGEEFNRLIIRRGLGSATCVYGFPGQCLQLFEHAKRNGLLCVLDQCVQAVPIEDRLVRPELDRWPGWEEAPVLDRVEAGKERQLHEWRLADLILCPSVFVKRGLVEMGVPQDKCRVVPYGVPCPPKDTPLRKKHRDSRRPTRVLFVGQVRLQKGVPYLLDAMRQFTPSEAVCKIVGPIKVARDKLEEYAPPNVTICGSVQRDAVRQYYEWADIFCLPTLCEGSATVVYEALLHGLPVVTTANSGSIIEQSRNSHHAIVPICNANAIAEAIRQVSSKERNGLDECEFWRLVSEASLEAYSNRLIDALLTLDAF